MKFINEQVLSGSVASNANSKAIYSAFLLYASLQIVSTGSPTASFKIQASNDVGNPQLNFTPTNWFDVPSATVTLSGSGVVAIPKTDIAYTWIRVVRTGGGTGTADVTIFGMGA